MMVEATNNYMGVDHGDLGQQQLWLYYGLWVVTTIVVIFMSNIDQSYCF